jgi:hypothetical protein
MSHMPQFKSVPQQAGTPSDVVMLERAPGRGWVGFAAIMLFMAGIFNVIDGIVALVNSRFYVADAVIIWSNLRTWGWIMLALGVITLLAGAAVLNRRAWGRWFGIIMAGLSAIGQMAFMSAYPWWSLLIIAIDVLVIYGLAVHWEQEAPQVAT